MASLFPNRIRVESPLNVGDPVVDAIGEIVQARIAPQGIVGSEGLESVLDDTTQYRIIVPRRTFNILRSLFNDIAYTSWRISIIDLDFQVDWRDINTLRVETLADIAIFHVEVYTYNNYIRFRTKSHAERNVDLATNVRVTRRVGSTSTDVTRTFDAFAQANEIVLTLVSSSANPAQQFETVYLAAPEVSGIQVFPVEAEIPLSPTLTTGEQIELSLRRRRGSSVVETRTETWDIQNPIIRHTFLTTGVTYSIEGNRIYIVSRNNMGNDFNIRIRRLSFSILGEGIETVFPWEGTPIFSREVNGADNVVFQFQNGTFQITNHDVGFDYVFNVSYRVMLSSNFFCSLNAVPENENESLHT